MLRLEKLELETTPEERGRYSEIINDFQNTFIELSVTFCFVSAVEILSIVSI